MFSAKVSNSKEEETLKYKLAEMFGGKVSSKKIRDEYLDIYFCKNKSFDEKLFNESEEGFIFSRYTAEVHPLHEVIEHLDVVDSDIYISILCHIIKKLRGIGCEVTAACEYEELINS